MDHILIGLFVNRKWIDSLEYVVPVIQKRRRHTSPEPLSAVRCEGVALDFILHYFFLLSSVFPHEPPLLGGEGSCSRAVVAWDPVGCCARRRTTHRTGIIVIKVALSNMFKY